MTAGPAVSIISRMDERGVLHRIEDALDGRWLEDYVGDGLAALEAYLANHLAFLGYLDDAATA